MWDIHDVKINLRLNDEEVPDLREAVGWDRRDADYPTLLMSCLFWGGIRNQEGKLIGFGYITGLGMEHGYMEDVMIHPEYQNQRIGTLLVTKLLQEAEHQEIPIVTVTFEEKNESFYQTCGFTPCRGGVWRRPSQ